MKRTLITIVFTLTFSAFAIQAVEQTAFSGAGIVESTVGGFKFPDGTTQMSASPASTEILVHQRDMPLTISFPGTYKLEEPITGVTSQHGISIQSSDVIIDLNGFALTGVSGSLSGIKYGANVENIVIRNGTINEWDEYGVSANFIAKILLMEDIVVSDNGLAGIWSSVPETNIRNCVLESNGGAGIWATESMTITGCRSANNAGNGIRADTEAVIKNNTCLANGLGPFTDAGIAVFGNARVEGNVLNSNHHGINVYGSGNVILENNVVSNVNRGFNVVGTGNLIVKNVVSSNGYANFDIAEGNSVGPIESADTSTSPVANIEF